MAQVDIPLFYDTDQRRFTTGPGDIATVTKIQLGQLNTVDVILAVIKDDVAIELTTPSWILGIKEINNQSGDYLIQTTTAVKTGTGTSTRYTFTFDFDSVELRAFFLTYDPAEDYLALEIRDTVNGIVTTPALIVDPLPAYTVDGTTPTDASGTLIVASGKTATISNTITLTGTDGESYNLDTLADVPAVRYTASQGLTLQQQIDARANISAPSVTEMQTADGLLLVKANNLSDVASAATSRTNLGLGNVDNTSDINKPISTATQTALDLKRTGLNVQTLSEVEETFIGGWLGLNAQVYGNGSLSWYTAQTGSSGLGSAYSETNHPGAPIFQAISGSQIAQLSSCRISAGVSTFVGSEFEFNFKLVTSGAVGRFFFGFRNYAVVAAETTMRGLFLDLVAGDTTWQAIHQNAAGTQTKVSTGKNFVSGEYVWVKVKIVSTTQTDVTIATAASQTEVTTSLTTGYADSGTTGIGWKLESTTGATQLLYVTRFIARLARTRF